MPGISRVGVDTAGGLITGNLAPTVTVNSAPIVVDGAQVAGHGTAPHSSPTMIANSANVFANNILVVVEGNSATCGHTATGSSNVFAGLGTPEHVYTPEELIALNIDGFEYLDINLHYVMNTKLPSYLSI